MTELDIPSIVEKLIEAGNAYDTEKYLSYYHKEGILDDPSVGNKFIGHKGIRDYFESYFIGYHTQTLLKKLEVKGDNAYLEVEFTGNFPGGIVMGTFDFTFKNSKIYAAKADLL